MWVLGSMMDAVGTACTPSVTPCITTAGPAPAAAAAAARAAVPDVIDISLLI
jgi:hypothetical protein